MAGRRMPTSHVIDFVPGRRDIGAKRKLTTRSKPKMLPLLTLAVCIVVSSQVTTACLGWSARLIAKILARQLQMPEALVHDAGRYVYAQLDAFERQLLHGLLGRNS
jgi:hypothetical protein